MVNRDNALFLPLICAYRNISEVLLENKSHQLFVFTQINWESFIFFACIMLR